MELLFYTKSFIAVTLFNSYKILWCCSHFSYKVIEVIFIQGYTVNIDACLGAVVNTESSWVAEGLTGRSRNIY